jgi:hypothetical protein
MHTDDDIRNTSFSHVGVVLEMMNVKFPYKTAADVPALDPGTNPEEITIPQCF